MPEMPAPLAKLANRTFGKPSTVVNVIDHSPELRRATFEVPSLVDQQLRPGMELEFLVTERSMRHYTLARFEAERGRIDVVFYLHGQGPGSKWAASLHEGQAVQVLGPGGNFRLKDDGRHVLLGDETCLGLFESVSHGRDDVRGAIECEARLRAAANEVHPGIDTVSRGADRGKALLDWLDAHPPHADEHVYLCGHGQSNKQLRQALLRRGHPRARLRVRTYWADGKRGL